MSVLEGPTFVHVFTRCGPACFGGCGAICAAPVFLAAFAWRNATLGRRVRNEYLRRKAAGEPFWHGDTKTGEILHIPLALAAGCAACIEVCP
jgi:hypothetical protein